MKKQMDTPHSTPNSTLFIQYDTVHEIVCKAFHTCTYKQVCAWIAVNKTFCAVLEANSPHRYYYNTKFEKQSENDDNANKQQNKPPLDSSDIRQFLQNRLQFDYNHFQGLSRAYKALSLNNTKEAATKLKLEAELLECHNNLPKHVRNFAYYTKNSSETITEPGGVCGGPDVYFTCEAECMFFPRRVEQGTSPIKLSIDCFAPWERSKRVRVYVDDNTVFEISSDGPKSSWSLDFSKMKSVVEIYHDKVVDQVTFEHITEIASVIMRHHADWDYTFEDVREAWEEHKDEPYVPKPSKKFVFNW